MEQKYTFTKVQQAEFDFITPSKEFYPLPFICPSPVHCLSTLSFLLRLFLHPTITPSTPLFYLQHLLITVTFILLSGVLLLLLLLPLFLSFLLSFPNPSYSCCSFRYYTSSLCSLQALLHTTSPSTPSPSPAIRPTCDVISPSLCPKTVPLPLQVHPVLAHLLLILLQPRCSSYVPIFV